MNRIKIVLILCIFSFPLTAQAFNDLTQDSPFYYAISDLEKRGLITGYEDGSVRADHEINRAEALKLTIEAFKKKADKNQEAPVSFTDIKPDTWYFPSIKIAVQNKIISGYDDNTFRPEQGVNLVEALKIVLLATQVKTTNEIHISYHDVDNKAWYSGFVQYAFDKNLISSQTDGLLHPEKKLSRGEFSKLLSRLLWSTENEHKAFPMYQHWQEVKQEEQFYKIKIPYGWEAIKQPRSLVVWKKDQVNLQDSFTRPSPYTATVHIMFDTNQEKIDQDTFFKNVRNRLGPGYGKYKEFTLKNKFPALRVETSRDNVEISDLYVMLPNNKLLVFYTTYGASEISPELRNFVIGIQHSLEFIEKGGIDVEALLEEARKAIAVDGKGKEIIDKFPDLELFETDAIGVGTGPVDYYFSPLANVTLKYERSFNVILALKEGKTSAF